LEFETIIYMAEQIKRHGREASNAAQVTGQLLSRINTGVWEVDDSARP
jgi:hypothetical protein